VDGKDGAPGPQGERGLQGERGIKGVDGRDGRDGLAGLQGEKGRDGRDGIDGKNGIDGLGFDDLDFTHDGERRFALRFVKGDKVKEFPFKVPFPIYRGIYKDGEWERGDEVTWGGSMWIAKRDTADKPETSDAWQLATKRGQNGRDLMPRPEHKGPVKV